MAVTPVTNASEQRSATILLQASTLNMCNAKTKEDLVKNFTDAKDLLIELYKYNAERLSSLEA